MILVCMGLKAVKNLKAAQKDMKVNIGIESRKIR
jgi:hypothetical protein